MSLLREHLPHEHLVLRLSRNMQMSAATFGVEDGQSLGLTEPPDVVIFREHGLRFEADVRRGQKTGFFLDQRENRARVEALAAGREVLNAFSFTGGFSVHAARGGARMVTDVDISDHALAGARRNFALNQDDAAVRACAHETVQADAFFWLEKQERQFDLIILDPPSLAKRETERGRAIQAYERLNRLGIARLRSGEFSWRGRARRTFRRTDSSARCVRRRKVQGGGFRKSRASSTRRIIRRPSRRRRI